MFSSWNREEGDNATTRLSEKKKVQYTTYGNKTKMSPSTLIGEAVRSLRSVTPAAGE